MNGFKYRIARNFRNSVFTTNVACMFAILTHYSLYSVAHHVVNFKSLLNCFGPWLLIQHENILIIKYFSLGCLKNEKRNQIATNETKQNKSKQTVNKNLRNETKCMIFDRLITKN